MRCKTCRHPLVSVGAGFHCSQCDFSYPVQDGIILMEDPENVNLRMDASFKGKKMLDLHKVREERMVFDRYLESDVDYYARLQSINFSNLHARLLRKHLHGARIADVGCGQLPYINAFAESGVKEYYALDLNMTSLTIAKQHAQPGFPLIPVQHGAYDLPFPDNSLDAVISCEVIEHLDRPMEHIAELNRVLKKGGYLSISTPNVSVYFYPHSFLRPMMKNIKKLRTWYHGFVRYVNVHRNWSAALKRHPALRPMILRQWLKEGGFDVRKHRTRLWYYGTPRKYAWRFFGRLEKIGLPKAGKMFKGYLSMYDRIFALNLPFIKWWGIRQFVLCKKI
ncbi:MAG: methyltransferase domain-containing protein [bacterium]|nr:methyltransferase domain-containing protein [bacterium]